MLEPKEGCRKHREEVEKTKDPAGATKAKAKGLLEQQNRTYSTIDNTNT